MLSDEFLNKASYRMESAAERMERAADRIESAAHRIGIIFEDGYGSNALRLLEVLEAMPHAGEKGEGE